MKVFLYNDIRLQVNLTSPQRSSLRQIISKRKTEMQEPLEWLRTVEYAQNPDTNQSEQNKIIFASALGLLPIKSMFRIHYI